MSLLSTTKFASFPSQLHAHSAPASRCPWADSSSCECSYVGWLLCWLCGGLNDRRNVEQDVVEVAPHEGASDCGTREDTECDVIGGALLLHACDIHHPSHDPLDVTFSQRMAVFEVQCLLQHMQECMRRIHHQPHQRPHHKLPLAHGSTQRHKSMQAHMMSAQERQGRQATARHKPAATATTRKRGSSKVKPEGETVKPPSARGQSNIQRRSRSSKCVSCYRNIASEEDSHCSYCRQKGARDTEIAVMSSKVPL